MGAYFSEHSGEEFDGLFEKEWNGGGAGDAEPVGVIKSFGGQTLPDGYLWCDGTSYPANGAYKKLYDVIGTAFNQEGDATGTFRVPDMRGRVGVGKDAETFNALGKVGGSETHILSVAELPSHYHDKFTYYDNRVKYAVSFKSGTDAAGFSADGNVIGTPSDEVTGNTGGNGAHNNMPPYLVCNYIIKYDRSYAEIGVTAPPCIYEFDTRDWTLNENTGFYSLPIPESTHKRGEHCVLTAMYETLESGSLKQVIPETYKDSEGNLVIYSDTAFGGKAYIDRVYMQPAGRVLTVNGQEPDVDGDIDILNKVYPVGSIYMSVNNINPATLFGGSWAAWGSGRVPIGVDTSQTEFNTVEKTGGDKAITLNATQLPPHQHYSVQSGGNLAADVYFTVLAGGISGGGSTVVGQYGSPSLTSSTGGGAAHSNLQPYVTCYMWKRTA